jgi:enoyl-[acyl-carrier protein] reductase I
MGFLGFEGKCFLVMGVSNRRSVGWAVARLLMEQGATVYLGVRSEKREQEVRSFAKVEGFFHCDVEDETSIVDLGKRLLEAGIFLDGLVHSIAFAHYRPEQKRFHETRREDFLQASQISAFSLVELARELKPVLKPDASVVTIGISSTEVTAENYGIMAPVKASLNAMVRYLAKSFSADSQVRFNAVNAGPLKTRASAGIPGYLENYLYAEKLTFRKRALEVREVADCVAFLLSPRSSGVNGQAWVVNAGMDFNYFDREIVEAATRVEVKSAPNKTESA